VRVVFGNEFTKAESAWTDHLPKGGEILIVGAGTGRTLKLIGNAQPKRVVALDKSSKMVERTRRIKVEFKMGYVTSDFLEYEPVDKFDVIVTPFFLDCFSPDTLIKVINKGKACLKKEGYWLATDFEVTRNYHHRLLLWFMHIFFRYSTGLESRSLQDIRAMFSKQGGIEIQKAAFMEGLIFSSLYRFSN